MSTRRIFQAAAAAILAAGSAQAAPRDIDPAVQRELQKKVLAEVEQTARRVSTSIRVLVYQRVAAGDEQKLLNEVAGTLRGLSNEQIQAVLVHLESAVKAPDEAAATAEQRQAYDKHRQIITSLRGLLVKLDNLKSLDQAADRFDRAAKEQFDLHLKTLGNVRLPKSRARRVVDDRDEIADAQSDLRTEVTSVSRQLDALKKVLNPDQKEKLEKSEAAARGLRVGGEMEQTAKTTQTGQLDEAAERQLRHAKELQAIAAALRSTSDKLAAMKEAREKLAKALDEQKNLNAETKNPDMKDAERNARRSQTDPRQVVAQKLGDQQAKLEFETRDIRRTLEDAAKEVADQLKPAESAMWKAEDRLRNTDLEEAQPPQKKAEETLRAAREKLDELIAKAELEKTDPLAAVQKAAEQIDQLIKEQGDAGKKADENAAKPEKLPEAAQAQKAVAKKTDEFKAQPLPPNDDAKKALDKATEAMTQAAKNLDGKNADAAKPQQADAKKALEDAKKALEDQAAAIEKRRDDLAKLEEAAKKLDELAKAEKTIADDAKKAADAAKADPAAKPETGDLAKKQENLTPPTKEVGEMVKEAVPEAAKKIDDATKSQDKAKTDLGGNKPMPGSEKANDAAKKLEEAKAAVEKKADELKAKEATDQAALQPNKVDPSAAAQQVAKAIEQAQQAADKANEAAKQLDPTAGEQPMNKAAQDIAKLQKEVAEQAEKLKQPDAAKDAAEAAKELQQGNLDAAIEQQQKALDKLEAAKNQPMPGGEKPMSGGEKPMAGAEKPMPGGEKPMPGGEKPMGVGEKPMPGGENPMGGMPDDGAINPKAAKDSGQLAKVQDQIKKATEALKGSQQANAAAQAALQQAQAQAPQSAQGQLQQAGQQLKQGAQQAQQGMPKPASQSNAQAAQSLQQALNALNAAAQAQGQPTAQPGQSPTAQAQAGQQPGQGQPGQQAGKQPGQGQPGQPGQQPGQPGQQAGQPGKQPGQAQEKNDGQGEGDRQGPAGMQNRTVSGKDQTGDGKFINLKARERDKVQQNAEAQFPAEFRELIKQYNINIKNNKPPAPGGK